MTKISRGIAVAALAALPFAGTTVARVHAAPQTRGEQRDEKSDRVLRDAITELEQIKSRIHGAEHIYGGHRGKADQHIDMAVAELRAALNYDEKSEANRKR